jgi:hypothetical protein
MPPAFNLSQDQTLQLNPEFAASLKVNEVTSLITSRGLLDALAVEGEKQKPFAGASRSSAHTYRLRIFKERWLRGEDLNL